MEEGWRGKTHRLVVPSTFFPVLRAEHTTAILLSFRLALLPLSFLEPAFSSFLRFVPDYVLRNFHSEFPHARPAKFLNHPASAAVVPPTRIGSYRGSISMPVRNWRCTHYPKRVQLCNCVQLIEENFGAVLKESLLRTRKTLVVFTSEIGNDKHGMALR